LGLNIMFNGYIYRQRIYTVIGELFCYNFPAGSFHTNGVKKSTYFSLLYFPIASLVVQWALEERRLIIGLCRHNLMMKSLNDRKCWDVTCVQLLLNLSVIEGRMERRIMSRRPREILLDRTLKKESTINLFKVEESLNIRNS